MDKSLSLNEIRSRCAKFVIDWRDSSGDERQEAQSFVRDLLMAYGISETKAALYEKRVQRSSTGNQGYIDALVPGLLLIEMKSAGRPLALAEAQAFDYIQHLPEAEVPRFILTSDFKNFRLIDIKAPKGSDVTEFGLEQLPSQAESLSFLAGYKTRSFGTISQEEASIKAARLMGELFEALEGSGYSEHESSIFLVRTLFGLYAEDAGIWQRFQFTDFVQSRTAEDGSDLGAQLTMLYQVLNQPMDKRMSNLDEMLLHFPYVNGGVFSEPLSIPAFDKKMRDQLLRACAFDWSEISPSIFGSLFQAVKSPEARRELGEHYTTEINIRKVIDPLFLDELRAEVENVSNNIRDLRKLRAKLGDLKVLDPACGCGNFLVVIYRELRTLELSILMRLQKLGDKESVPPLFFTREDLAVQLSNVYGIEIEEWPARIAQTALLLTEHQANQTMELALGKSPSILPLETVEGIRIGNALQVSWSEVVAPGTNVTIIGNPPFIGHQQKKPGHIADLKEVWGKDYDGYLDYVTGWFKKAADFFVDLKGGRFAFVSTNSIVQGQPVEALFKPLFEAGYRIRFAHQTFAWSSEAPGAAGVHCVITGFDKHEKTDPQLFVYANPKSEPVQIPATNINGYLVDAPEFFIEKRSRPLSKQLPVVNFGTMPIDGGNLIVESKDLAKFQADPIAAKYLRPFIGAKELIQGLPRFCLWLEDVIASDVRSSALLKERIDACKVFREASTTGGDAFRYRTTPHLFRPNSKRPKVPYACFPGVVSEGRKYFTVGHFDADVIASNAVFTAEDADGFAFAVASSSMFISWQRMVGGRLESRLRFSNTVVWNNLPLPEVTDELRLQIVEAGRKILELRESKPNSSLADLYHPLAMDPILIKAHSALDKLVDRAFGAKATLQSDVEREELLAKSYRELAAAN
jgi:hypothetical protein